MNHVGVPRIVPPLHIRGLLTKYHVVNGNIAMNGLKQWFCLLETGKYALFSVKRVLVSWHHLPLSHTHPFTAQKAPSYSMPSLWPCTSHLYARTLIRLRLAITCPLPIQPKSLYNFQAKVLYFGDYYPPHTGFLMHHYESLQLPPFPRILGYNANSVLSLSRLETPMS